MKMEPCEVSDIIKSQIEKYNVTTKTEKVGYVVKTGDGIATVYGLMDCMFGELLRFESGEFGMAMNLEEDSIACVILGDDTNIREGTKVESTG